MAQTVDSRKAVAGGVLAVVSSVVLFLSGNVGSSVAVLVAAASAVGLALGTLLLGTSSGAGV